MTNYPYYQFLPDKYEGAYWNSNGKGIAIVASVTEDIDWAAYIGADNGQREDACLQWTAERGAKLSEADARHYFPEIKLPYRR